MAMLNNQMVISNSKYSKPQMLTLFDRQWRYMPKTKPTARLQHPRKLCCKRPVLPARTAQHRRLSNLFLAYYSKTELQSYQLVAY